MLSRYLSKVRLKNFKSVLPLLMGTLCQSNMNIRLFIFLLTFYVPISLLGQGNVVLLRGQIIDQTSNEPVPFANLKLNNFNYGTSTNLEGRFELKLNTDRFSGDNQLSISCIGYKTLIFRLLEVDHSTYQTITLEQQENDLDDVIVRSSRAARKENNQAKTLLMDAIKSIPSNRGKTNYLAKSFYRHYCKEDEDYVRLTEAAIDIYQYKKGGDYVQVPEHKLQFSLSQMRRSFDYTSFAKLSHPPISLNFLLSNDLTHYEFHNPIRRDLNSFQFVVGDTTSLDSEPVIVLEFEPKDPNRLKLNYSGKLFINLVDKAIIRADIHEVQAFSNSLDSIHSVVAKQVFFQKIGKRYYPQRILSDVTATHFTANSTGEMQNPVEHQSHVELMINELQLKGKANFSMGEPSEEALRNVNYDSSFWNSYTVLQATPLEEEIIKDLSKKVTLNKQFEAVNTLKEGLESIVENPKFQSLLTEFEDKPIYTILWAKWSVPNFYELIPSPYMRKMIKKGKIKLLMVSLDESETDWLTNREIYGLEKAYITHKRVSLGFGDDITRDFYQALMPDYFLLNGLGAIIDHSPPLPNQAEVKPYYQHLLKYKSVKAFAR